MSEGRPEPGELYLRSVNWEHGMLLTPEHFLRQERYLESLTAWGVRYLSAATGLVGGGLRLPDSDLGTVRFDPEVRLHEMPEYLEISVARARGMTPGGGVVEVDATGAVSTRFPKEQLAGVAEAVVYVVWENSARVKTDGAADSFNPQMRTERMPNYRVALGVNAAERAQSLAVGRVRRPASGMYFEADAQYIPPCVAVSSHSELMAGTRRIADGVNRLASGYAELHRAMREFMVLFTERGLETEVDRDSMQFAERMVLELQDTAYSLLDRTQTPEQFFARVRRMLHSAAIFFDLAPGMQQYYDTLRETGESELVGLIELQKHTLQMGRNLRLNEDLGLEVRKALGSLSGLERLERALEGKYIDFRRSATLESTNFIFDRGGKALYKLAARPARVQGIADDMTIYFSNLRLEGRDRYRLILVGDRNTPWQRGTSIGAEVRINEGSGFRRESLILTGDVKLDEQYNIELDFEAPDVPTITDLRVTVPAYHTVHTALLFIRHRFYAGNRETTPARLIEREAPMGEPAGLRENGFGRESRLDRMPEGGAGSAFGRGMGAGQGAGMGLGTSSTGTGLSTGSDSARQGSSQGVGAGSDFGSGPGTGLETGPGTGLGTGRSYGNSESTPPSAPVQPPWMPRDSGTTPGTTGEDSGAAKPRRRRLE